MTENSITELLSLYDRNFKSIAADVLRANEESTRRYQTAVTRQCSGSSELPNGIDTMMMMMLSTKESNERDELLSCITSRRDNGVSNAIL